MRAGAQPLYLRLLPDEFLAEARKRENNRVYSTPVVMLLMIIQRLQDGGCLESAVLELPGLPASLWPDPCKRLQPGQGDMSSATGAYNKARQELPSGIVGQFCDHAFAQLTACIDGSLPAIGRRAFMFDGTTVRTPHTKELKQLYPPTANQKGESHWPLIKLLVAHDLVTGLGMRPEWGAVNGPDAVSEQGLFEKAVERLPEQAVVVADANFGVFSVAYAAVQQDHPVVVRMTVQRAKSLLLQMRLRDGIDRRITWKPTKADRKGHPELPPDACVRGRLIVSRVQPSDNSDPFLLCLFTTLEDDKEEIVKIYGQRWNVETDIGTLKGELRLDQLTCKTPQMVHKELEISMLTYNLVRAVTYQAAQKAGIAPRRFSFTKVKRVLNVYGPKIAAAKTEQEAEALVKRMNHYIGQAILPKRKGKRKTYPRAIWNSSKPFPRRKAVS
jgi:hypothetical protein